MEAKKYFKEGKTYIWRENFAVVKAKKTCPKAFANIIDKKEITVIIDQSKFNVEEAIEIEKDWKIITFDMVLPFGLVGFMASISQALAEENIPLFVISAYSTDHILVKRKDITKTKKKLEKLGFVLKEK